MIKDSKDKRVVLAIDFGTTNSLVAVSVNNELITIPDEQGIESLKSIFAYDDDSNIVLGEKALNCTQYVKSIKRTIPDNDTTGITVDFTVDKILKFKFDNQNSYITSLEISSKIIESLKNRAEKFLQVTCSESIITVPAYFHDTARQFIIDAARIAGLKVLKIINEPTAAMLAYEFSQNGIYVVYDFGGGTFDVSILKLNDGLIKVIGTKGDNFLGGDDLDQAIKSEIIASLELTNLSKEEERYLLEISKDLKESLLFEESIEKVILNQKFTITRAQYNKIIEPFINKTVQILDSLIRDVKINPQDIASVLLVGGSSKVIMVKELLQDFLKNTQIILPEFPEKLVVQGAAKHAEKLVTGSGKVLLDVLPLSLGIETMGGLIETIIPRNTPLPFSQKQQFTTFADCQTHITISIWQGEKEITSDEGMRCLGTSKIKVPVMPAGYVKVDIIFSVNENGILTVKTEGDSSEFVMEHNISVGLSKEDVNKMIKSFIKTTNDDYVEKERQIGRASCRERV